MFIEVRLYNLITLCENLLYHMEKTFMKTKHNQKMELRMMSFNEKIENVCDWMKRIFKDLLYTNQVW